jgi:osmotically-inducible protein OsmY
MRAEEPIVNLVIAAFGQTSVRGEIAVALSDDALVLEGNVDSIADKRRAVMLAQKHVGVRVVDRIRVAPSAHMRDRVIEAHLNDAIDAESSLTDSTIMATADSGVVTIDGFVPSVGHKRLAGVLAWWVPGTRDVVNRLVTVSKEAGEDEGDLIDAIQMAIDKDPLVDGSQIRVTAHGGSVTLHGSVASEIQRRIAERDAWYVLGVANVTNDLEVVARSSSGA